MRAPVYRESRRTVRSREALNDILAARARFRAAHDGADRMEAIASYKSAMAVLREWNPYLADLLAVRS